MFTALLLVCFSFNKECMVVTDTRGPYGTLSQCEARLEEMIGYLNSAKEMPPFILANKKCESAMGEST